MVMVLLSLLLISIAVSFEAKSPSLLLYKPVNCLIASLKLIVFYSTVELDSVTISVVVVSLLVLLSSSVEDSLEVGLHPIQAMDENTSNVALNSFFIIVTWLVK